MSRPEDDLRVELLAMAKQVFHTSICENTSFQAIVRRRMGNDFDEAITDKFTTEPTINRDRLPREYLGVLVTPKLVLIGAKPQAIQLGERNQNERPCYPVKALINEIATVRGQSFDAARYEAGALLNDWGTAWQLMSDEIKVWLPVIALDRDNGTVVLPEPPEPLRSV